MLASVAATTREEIQRYTELLKSELGKTFGGICQDAGNSAIMDGFEKAIKDFVAGCKRLDHYGMCARYAFVAQC